MKEPLSKKINSVATEFKELLMNKRSSDKDF
jgi:hypothetical protein